MYGGEPTLKTFLARVEDFVLMYPNIWAPPNTPVACRVPIHGIIEIANPRVIACRSNSSALLRDGHDAARRQLAMNASALQLAMNTSGVGGGDGGLQGLLASLATPLRNIETRPRRSASSQSLSPTDDVAATAASPDLIPIADTDGN